MKRLRRGAVYLVVVSTGTVLVGGAFSGAIDALAYAISFYVNLPDSWSSNVPQRVDFDIYLTKMAPLATRYSMALTFGWIFGAAAFVYGVFKRMDDPKAS